MQVSGVVSKKKKIARFSSLLACIYKHVIPSCDAEMKARLGSHLGRYTLSAEEVGAGEKCRENAGNCQAERIAATNEHLVPAHREIGAA